LRIYQYKEKRKKIMKLLTCEGLMYKVLVEGDGFQTEAAINECFQKHREKQKPFPLLIDILDWDGASFTVQSVPTHVLLELRKVRIIPHVILRTPNGQEIRLGNVSIRTIKRPTPGSQASVATRVWYQVLPFKEEEAE
jgi:hypothetical protein